MIPPRKTLNFTACLASVAVFLFSSAPAILAQEVTQEKHVALKTADGKYVTAADKGAFNLSGKGITNRTVFAIVDANGGTLADGDEITIKYYSSPTDKPSFWQEQAGKLLRAKEPKDASGKFKLKKQGEGFVLQTGSGKFVAYKERELEVVDTAEGGLVLNIEEQPAAK